MSASPKPSGSDDRTPEERLLDAIYKHGRDPLDPSRAAPPTIGGGPPTPPPPSDRDKTIHNERVKLTATFLNGVALAFVVGGGVATLLGLGGLANANDQLPRALVWIVIGGVMHAGARWSLGRLR